MTTTLGTTDDEQRIESLEGLKRQRFMLHYNFPPYSVGETGMMGDVPTEPEIDGGITDAQLGKDTKSAEI